MEEREKRLRESVESEECIRELSKYLEWVVDNIISKDVSDSKLESRIDIEKKIYSCSTDVFNGLREGKNVKETVDTLIEEVRRLSGV